MSVTHLPGIVGCSIYGLVKIIMELLINKVEDHAMEFNFTPSFEELQRSILGPQCGIHVPLFQDSFKERQVALLQPALRL
jgi:hypothetical protein